MRPGEIGPERLRELLADRAGGEPQGERTAREIELLLAAHPEVDEASFERAASAVHLALLGPLEPPPPELIRRIERRAKAWFGWEQESSRERGVLATTPWLGWIVAAAACVFLLLWRGPSDEAVPSLESVSHSDDAVAIDWQPTADAGDVKGSVVWSNSLQAGYMRFRGLPPNDPTRGQYQLWIFDADRPSEYPIDGGVFDAGEGEIVVPVRAKLAVVEPSLFAVTYERPGGVVVSSRERLLVTAAVH